jgi:uncharacterized protein (DUF433 family)
MTPVALEYIEVDERGVAKLIGHRIKVMHLVATMRCNKLSVEQLLDQFPDVNPAFIYAALAYYHEHKAEVEAHLEASERFADEMRQKYPNKVTRAELEARWRKMYPGRPLPSETEPEPI